MPQFHEAWNVERMRKGIKAKRSSGRARSHTDSDPSFLRSTGGDQDAAGPESALPPQFRARLHSLFHQIEKEFESLYLENLSLTEKNEVLEKTESTAGLDQKASTVPSDLSDIHKSKAAQAQKIKPAQKLKVQTSRIVSSFRAPLVTTSLVSEFLGHRDGVWDVAASKLAPVIATASADQRAYIWNAESTKLLSQYVGHSGSVNSVVFHPTQELVLTASGDQTAQIWRPTYGSEPVRALGQQVSSEEELDDDAGNYFAGSAGAGEAESEDPRGVHKIANYLQIFRGHTGVVIAADWLPGPGRVITASWDRTANLYDTETGDLILPLTGHDAELTHVCGHPTHQMAVTCSKDTTFRLWDFRDPFHSVSVFQGHTEPVTSAVLLKDDRAVSGSDDRTVKVWDLRNMRSPQAAIQLDSPANRLAVNSAGFIAIPHDNRHIRIYDVSGQRLARLPRNSRQGHRRMVCSAAWAPPEQAGAANLFTCGFDRRILGWKVVSTKDGKD